MIGVVLGVFVGCAGPEPDRESQDVLVFTASSLAGVLEEMELRFEQEGTHTVSVVLGSSGALAAQIRRGAPADLFLSAAPAFVDDLVTTGIIDSGTRTTFAVGRLALAVPPGHAIPGSILELRDPLFEVITIANPDHAPYGVAARSALRRVRIWEEIEPRIVFGESVGAATQFVRSGSADAGVVAASLVVGRGSAGLAHLLMPDTLHDPVRHVAGVVARGTNTDGARAFLDFIGSAVGREILVRHGFGAPAGMAAEVPAP